jgi:hypothetical protein
MKTSYIIASIVGVIVVGGIWASMSGKSSQTVDSTTSVKSSMVSADGSFKGSLADLMKGGKSYQCTVNQTVEGITSTGTVYVSGEEHIRGDFTSTIPSYGNVKSSMITDASSVYVWTSMMSQGFKSPRTTENTKVTGNTEAMKQGLDINQQLDYNCTPWTVDMSVFAVPTNITFKTM